MEFPFKVQEAVEAGGYIVVLLRVPPGQTMTENVFGVSLNGEVVWQIERIPETSSDPNNAYVGITKMERDMVRIANWNDFVVEINPSDGRIQKKL